MFSQVFLLDTGFRLWMISSLERFDGEKFALRTTRTTKTTISEDDSNKDRRYHENNNIDNHFYTSFNSTTSTFAAK